MQNQKPEKHGLSIKKRCLEVKNDDFWENMLRKKKYISFELFPLFKGPGWAHTDSYGPLWAHMDPKNPKKYVTIRLYRCL